MAVLDRREWLSLTAGVGLTMLAPPRRARAAAQSAPVAACLPSVPAAAFIRTSLLDLDPCELRGATLFHEHLGDGRPPVSGAPTETPLQNPVWLGEELRATARAGVSCIVAVQATMPGPETLAYLRALSRRSGVHIIPAGGLLMLSRYPAGVPGQSIEQLTNMLVDAADMGRFGAFGEFGVDNGASALASTEMRAFRALGRAHMRTGLPIITHCNYGTGHDVPADMALRQLDLLESEGVRPESCAIGHICCLRDAAADVGKRLARRGAFVGFDRLSRQEQWVSDEARAGMIVALLEAGYEDRLLFSSDYGGTINTATGERNAYTGPLHARDGGPGYARSLSLFMPKLRKLGVSDAVIQRITVDNPRRFLAFLPRPIAAPGTGR